jgi:hypothetical protein
MTALLVPARTARNVGIADLVELLQAQQRQKLDIVVPATTLHMDDGHLVLAGLDPVLNEDGFTDVNGGYRMTAAADTQLGGLFDIPTRYIKKMRGEHPALLDTNVNEWAGLHDPAKKVLVRVLWGQPEVESGSAGSAGICRALLSDRYGVIDNLDVVMSLLDGMREAGLGAQHIKSCDLSDDKLYLRVNAPELMVNAPTLLEGYRSPFAGSGHGGAAAENPYAVSAGILVTNSETGGGAFTVTPELRIKICDNGATINADALRKVHMGGRLEEGTIAWSDATRAASSEFVKQQMKDAVSSFMTVEYVAGAVARLEQSSGVELADPQHTITVVAKKLAYTQAEQAGILAHFIRGGQVTSGGVLQAVTSFAQEIDDVDRANEFAATGVDAMLVAATV